MVKIQMLTNTQRTLMVCDACEEVIADHTCAHIVFPRDWNEGDSVPTYHVHKNDCEARLAERIGPLSWNPIDLHLRHLWSNVGLAPSDFDDENDPLSLDRFSN